MIPSDAFPRPTPQNHRVTSPADTEYNCIAWSAGDVGHWWQPGVFGPVPAEPNDFGLGALESMFRARQRLVG